MDEYVEFLMESRFKSVELSDRRIKAVNAIRWIESGKSSQADKDSMIESWKCYEKSLEAAEREAKKSVVPMIDYGKLRSHDFWDTSHGAVIIMRLEKQLESGRVRSLRITDIKQNAQAYKVIFTADDEQQATGIRKDAIVPKEVAA